MKGGHEEEDLASAVEVEHEWPPVKTQINIGNANETRGKRKFLDDEGMGRKRRNTTS